MNITSFNYNTHNIVRRVPNEIGKIWMVLSNHSINNNEGFPCRSHLSGEHSGSCTPKEMDWIVAKDENGNFLIAVPK